MSFAPSALALALAAGPAGGQVEGEFIRIRHAMGETLVPRISRRVAVLTNEGTEAVVALGSKPVAAVRSWLGDPFYPHLAPALAGVAVVGDEEHPQLETIAGLSPDLILGNRLRQEGLYPDLATIAPTVFSETLRGEWKANLILYAEALGEQDRAARLLADWRKRVDAYRMRAGARIALRVSLVRFMDGKTRILKRQTFAGSILHELGQARPTTQSEDAWVEVVELGDLQKADGDLIFYFTYDAGDGRALVREREWLSHPAWLALGAVRAGRAFRVDEAIWNTAGGILAARLMLEQLEAHVMRLQP